MKIPARKAVGWESEKISVSQPNYPVVESPSATNPPATYDSGRTIYGVECPGASESRVQTDNTLIPRSGLGGGNRRVELSFIRQNQGVPISGPETGGKLFPRHTGLGTPGRNLGVSSPFNSEAAPSRSHLLGGSS